MKKAMFLALCILVSGVASGQEGGGSVQEIPSWFATVKLSESPYLSTGSGCFLTDRVVLTCYHNIEDYEVDTQDKLFVVDHTGHRYKDVLVIKTDPAADLALLYIGGKDLKPHDTVRVQPVLSTGVEVTSYGWNPEVSEFQVTTGKVSETRYLDTDQEKRVGFVHNGKVVQGMSGGPAIGPTGFVVGVNVAAYGDRSYTVSCEYIQQFLGYTSD